MFDELLSNAIDSFLIRRANDSTAKDLDVHFNLEFFDAELEGNVYDLRVSCADNGAGFGSLETKAFVTKDTSFKDDLGVEGIGRCKGTGRVQYFHFFNKLSVSSIFTEEGLTYERRLELSAGTKELDEDNFKVFPASGRSVGTTLTLDGIRDQFLTQLAPSSSIKEDLSAFALKQHLLVNFLHRLVGLKEHIGDFSIRIQTNYKKSKPLIEEIGASALPEHASSPTLNVPYG